MPEMPPEGRADGEVSVSSPGFGCCPDCGGHVLFALAVTGDVIAFRAAFKDGPWAIAWDITRTPRCRPVGESRTVRDDEYLYERHALSCTVTGPVTDLAAERIMRRPAVAPRTPEEPAARVRRLPLAFARREQPVRTQGRTA